MNTVFSMGILHPHKRLWMGQQQYVYAAGLADIIVQGLKSGSEAYGSYEGVQQAEIKQEGIEAEARAKAAAAATQAAMMQTSAAIQAAQTQQNQVAGVDKSVFFLGAAALAAAVIFGVVKMMGSKK